MWGKPSGTSSKPLWTPSEYLGNYERVLYVLKAPLAKNSKIFSPVDQQYRTQLLNEKKSIWRRVKFIIFLKISSWSLYFFLFHQSLKNKERPKERPRCLMFGGVMFCTDWSSEILGRCSQCILPHTWYVN